MYETNKTDGDIFISGKKITENNSIDEITDTESSRLSYMIYWVYVDVSISVTVFPYNTNHITFT